MHRSYRSWGVRIGLAGLLALLVTGLTANPVHAEPLQFNRDIRPILSEHCFACHGFDAKQRKGDLRLDQAEDALAKRDDHAAIVPGKPDTSELWLRVNSDDTESVMPPPTTKKTLTAAQKALLKKWIEEGAAYQKHWAFEPVQKPAEPKVNRADWSRSPVDLFILARLEKEGLTPQAEASRETLIRRVSFTLTGLPPTPAEQAAYFADSTPQAYERMVDRYLQSPHYGEEMAKHWLDVARYADTHGLHLDNERTMWAYRDWVVQAFNRNLPFDQFTVDQLAGDLRPDPTPEQLIATGFNRCNVTTSEGGSIEAEFLYRYAVDRTSTMIQAWMGLTGNCAVCHDHKYDPLTMHEFYSLYSFFYSAADPAMDRNTNTTDPFYKIMSPQQKSELEALRQKEQQTRQQYEQAKLELPYADPAGVQPPPAKIPVTLTWLDDQFPLHARVNCTSRNPSLWALPPEVTPAAGRRSLKQASASNYQDKIELPATPFFLPGQARLSVSIWVDPQEPPQALLLELVSSSGNRRFTWGDATKFGAAKTDKTWLGEIPPAGAWVAVEIPAEKLELKENDSIRQITLGQFGGIVYWDRLQVQGELDPVASPLTSFAAWWKERTGKDTVGVPGELQPVLKDGPDKNPPAEMKEKLQKFYQQQVLFSNAPTLLPLEQAALDAASARNTLEDSIPGTFIFRDLPQPREAFVMKRGQYDQPADKVTPATPAALPPLKLAKPDQRPTRMDLAQWLVSPEHPLTARVAANRFWQQVFGTGLVKTSADFGSQGQPPSHPELLDWLAATYREQGWDTKALMKMLVMSSTFRQQTIATPELRQRDPDNRLLARGPRFRLDAEQIRDNALFVGGLLNLQMGGRGVNSYQPPNIWEPVGYSDSNTRFYLQDHGANLYRRSLYSFLKRTAPPPFMSNFDAPNREQVCAVRERSNTPLQALQLLNDTQHFEAARGFAGRILTDGGRTAPERISFAFQVVLARKPTPREQEILEQTLSRYLDRYQKDPDAAHKAVHVGESKPVIPTSEPELAAYTLLSNLLLNLDETVNRN